MTMQTAAPKPKHLVLLTACIMLATIMQALDTTIANVALPYMQGSLSATVDQINWVLTSYIVAAAITTPVTGLLEARLGRKRLFLIAVAGFTVASVLCGLAGTLPEMVLFRLLQGVFGAALVPLSQAVLLDIYPQGEARPGDGDVGHRRHGRPDPGPDAGRLADRELQLALGLLHQPADRHPGLPRPVGLSHARPRSPRAASTCSASPCSALAIGSFQMMLDRGEQLDWFSSTEIIVEAVVAALAFYLFLVQTFTAKQPFIDPHDLQGPQFHHRALLHLRGRHHPARLAGPAHALPAEPDGLSGDHRRPGAGAARRRHHGRHDDRRPHHQPGRSAPPAGRRPAADGRGAVGDDRLHARRLAMDADPHRRHAGHGAGLHVRAALDHHLRHPAGPRCAPRARRSSA